MRTPTKLSSRDAAKLGIGRQSKYRAVPTVVDGIRFASKKEAAHYGLLKVMQEADEIRGLTLQPKYPIRVNGVKVCIYLADFLYHKRTKDDGWIVVVVDCKGVKTPVYRLKRKLVKAVYGIEIEEI